ncbi:MAG TPA: manganese catalase family protein [Casimicrobiaceae bacterium]|nr:manganese catalase family protein [Casimicrobiaceae bacterium]
MFAHNKRLQYTVRVAQTNPVLANLMLEQFGGPQGELAAAMRYFTQAIAEDDPGRRDMLFDIATEELSHLEIIGTIVCMLNKGIKGAVAEGLTEQGELFRRMNQGGDSHVTSLLYGGGAALTNSGGVPWSAAYIDTIGEPTADLRSNIAAEARAKMIYERLINVTDDSGVAEALGFLMTREVAHQKAFEKALYSIEPNFPPGKLPGVPEFRNKYFNMSVGEGDVRGPWNQGEQWEFVDGEQSLTNADPGGDGSFSVQMTPDQQQLDEKAKQRLASDLESDPTTGADLGAGPGAGAITGESAESDDELPENPVGARRSSQQRSSSRTTRTRR